MIQRLVVSSTTTILWLRLWLAGVTIQSCDAQWALHSYTGGAVVLGMTFDPVTNIGMVVGGAYQETFGVFSTGNAGPRCLVGVFDNAQGIVTQRLSFPFLEVCTHVINAGNQKGILLGYQPSQSAQTGVTKVDEVIGTLDLVGNPPPSYFQAVDSESSINYPVQGALNEDGSAMFVVFHQTDTLPSSLKDQNLDPLSQIIYLQEEMQSGKEEDSGNAIWSPGLQKWNVATNELEWATVSWVITDDRVTIVSSIVHVHAAQGGFLLVGGYSKGGPASLYDNWRGFLAKIDPSSGQSIETTYIISQDRKNDIVKGICVSGDGDFAFVVGSTQGIIDGIHVGGAFLIKYDVQTLVSVWQRQIHGEGVEGMYCAVHDDIVYVGGNVPAKVEVEIGKRSFGTGQDMFVAQIATDTAKILWTRQFGSDTRDTIQGLATDQDGNAVLCGNSFNETAWQNDAFIMTMERKDGTHTPKWIQLVPSSAVKDTPAKDRTGLIIAGSIILPILLAIIVLSCAYHRRGLIEEPPQDHQEAVPTPALMDAEVL